MGITIHYQGKLKSAELINRFIFEVEEITKMMKWDYQVIDDDLSEPPSAEMVILDGVPTVNGSLGLRGLNIQVHEKCCLSLLVDRHGILRDLMDMVDEDKPLEPTWTSCKTQFTTPDVHMTIIKLMRYLGDKFFDEFTVSDEGEYWESEDEVRLKQRFRLLTNVIDSVEEALSKGTYEQVPDLDLVKKIELMIHKQAMDPEAGDRKPEAGV